ncbi:MAG: protein kinase, partial [Phycisphaeraceae bacterium]|nr:protein kinase [Phycisphaeraceae bacterium]
MVQDRSIAGYHVLNALGHGARSHIYAVRGEDGKEYALKHVVREQTNDDRVMEQAIREHEIAQKFDHPVLRKSLELIRRRKLFRVSEIIVIMELFDGQTLEHWDNDDLLSFCHLMLEVCGALHHMHSRGFVHADLKPNNILVD